MNDDLQDQINAQILAASSRQKEAISESDDNEINLPNPRGISRPAKISARGGTKIGPSTPLDDEDGGDIKPIQTFDLSTIELKETPLIQKLSDNAPKSIADLLHLEKEVAMNPPKFNSSYIAPGKTAVIESGPLFKLGEKQPKTKFYPSSVPQKNGATIPSSPKIYPATTFSEIPKVITEVEKTVIQNESTEKEAPLTFSAVPKDQSAEVDDINSRLKTIDYTPKKDSDFIKKLRTFKSDVADAMQAGASMVSIAAAEADKRAIEAKASATVMPNPETKKEKMSGNNVGVGVKIMALLLSFTLIGAGAFAVYFLQSKQGEPITIIDDVNVFGPLIPVQFTVPIGVDDRNTSYLRANFDAERKRNTGKINEIGEVLFLTSNTENPEIKERSITTSEFFTFLGMRPPVSLIRTLNDHFMAGFHRFGEIESFLIFRTDTYDVARSAMLEWENTLEDEVGTFLRSPSDFQYAIATDATINRRKFEDKVYKNIDTRALLDDKGKPLFIYAFINRSHLVFATNPETLPDIITGLSTKKVSK